MEIGAFTLNEPVPELKNPHALVMLRPWVDVGSVGAMALGELQKSLDAQPMGQLTRPGAFFDFTRYRPMSFFKDGQREIEIPNSSLLYAKQPESHDIIFMRLLEPHSNGEEYMESVLQVLEHFQVVRYATVGGMYDMVPHTRPLLISGTSSDPLIQERLTRFGARQSRYEGPTSILTLLPQKMLQRGKETLSMLVRLPQYAPLEEDFAGTLRVLEVLCDIYEMPLDLTELRKKAEDQNQQISIAVEGNQQLKRALVRLEERYDSRAARRQLQEPPQEPTPLPPSIEEFLRELNP